jgi:hypothetical protein
LPSSKVMLRRLRASTARARRWPFACTSDCPPCGWPNPEGSTIVRHLSRLAARQTATALRHEPRQAELHAAIRQLLPCRPDWHLKSRKAGRPHADYPASCVCTPGEVHPSSRLQEGRTCRLVYAPYERCLGRRASLLKCPSARPQHCKNPSTRRCQNPNSAVGKLPSPIYFPNDAGRPIGKSNLASTVRPPPVQS